MRDNRRGWLSFRLDANGEQNTFITNHDDKAGRWNFEFFSRISFLSLTRLKSLAVLTPSRQQVPLVIPHRRFSCYERWILDPSNLERQCGVPEKLFYTTNPRLNNFN